MNIRLKTGVIVLALLSLGTSAVCLASSSSFKKAHRLTQRGERALQIGNIESAREAFEGALDVESGFPTAHVGLGHVAMSGSEFETALTHYQAALEEFGQFGAMVEEIQAKRYRSARSEVASLRDTISELRSVGTALARMQISKLELAISRLEVIEPPDPDAIERPPAEFHFYLGNALFQLGRVDEAIASWERCRDAKPRFAMVYNNLALAYWKRGRLDDALAALDRADELGFPVNPEFRADLERASAAG